MNSDASDNEEEALSSSSLELSDYEESSMEDDDLQPIQVEQRRFLDAPVYRQAYGSSAQEIQRWQNATHNLLEDCTVDFAIAHQLTRELMQAINALLQRIGTERGHQLLKRSYEANHNNWFLHAGEYANLSWIIWNPIDDIFEEQETLFEFGNCPKCLTAMPIGLNCPYCPGQCSGRLYFMGTRSWKDRYDKPNTPINRTLEEFLHLSQGFSGTYSPHKIAELVDREDYTIVKHDRCVFNDWSHDPRRDEHRSYLPTTIPFPGRYPWHAMSIEQLIKKIAAHYVETNRGLRNLPIDIENRLRDCTGATQMEIRNGVAECHNCFSPRANWIVRANRFNLEEDRTFDKTEDERIAEINSDQLDLLRII